MKVCPHCAEELEDRATNCPQCGNDPSVMPSWAVSGRPGAEPPSWTPAAGTDEPWQRFPERGPRSDLPDPFGGQEPAAGWGASVHPLVWVASALTLFGGSRLVPGLNGALYEVAASSPGTAKLIHAVIWFINAVLPLVLSIVARRQVSRSKGRYGGGAIASVLIGVNLVSLAVPLVFSLARP